MELRQMIVPPYRYAKLSRCSRLSLLAFLITFCVALAGCEDDDTPAEGTGDEQTVYHHDLTGLENAIVADLTSIADEHETTLQVGRSTMYDRCHELLEEDGEPRALPFDVDETGVAFFGCGVVGDIKFDDGRVAVAYEIPMEGTERATDLRIVVYNPDGQVRWHSRLDRSHQRPNFTANHRSSYLTSIEDRMVCAGTRWTSNTQLMCASLDSGTIHYSGHLSFVAGLDFFGFDGSLFSTDNRGITRRYPFTGAEMRHRAFDERGGRAAFYGTDEKRIFFVPSEGEPELSGWNLETLRPIWTADLEAIPNPSYFSADANHQILFFLLDETLAAVDTTTGELRFAYHVGESRPVITYSEDEIFILVRHADVVPTLNAVNPRTGEIRWSAAPPTGSLSIAHIDDQLMVRSVRTVRPVSPATE